MALMADNKEILKKEEKDVISVRFKEVAVYFSEEEWSQLGPWQKELYSNVMRDIHTTLLSLGYSILHPDVLCRIRRDHEPYISSQEEDHKGVCFPSSSASVLSSDIIFKIKRDEDPCLDEGNPTDSCTKCASVLTPDIIFRIKHDEEVCPDEEDGPHGSTKSEFGFPAVALINEEGKSGGVQEEDRKDILSNEDVTLEISEANQLVFNPKFSIWIKQVDEVSKVSPEVLSAACTDGNVAEVKTEMDFIPDFKKSPPPQDLPETALDKNTILESHQMLEKKPKEEHAGKGEESLLSIVLRRANSGSLYIPNYKYSSGYNDVDYSRGVPGMAEKETCYPPKLSFFQTPNSNDLLSSFHAHPAPRQQCAPQIDKPFRCRICNKCFKTLGILNVHLKTHSGVRPYQCSECGKSFRDNWNLKVHQKIHTGETPYRCTICDKGFIQYATYMKHQRIHTGEKPYSCCYCDKSFTNSSNLVRHYRTHTGEKPYVCKECGKCFSYNTSLIQHKRIHKVEPAENGTNSPSNKSPTETWNTKKTLLGTF